MRRFLSLFLLSWSALAALAQTTPTARYATVADMVAARIPAVPAGASGSISALVTGRVTAQDGGGGLFFFVPASVATTNLGTVFPSSPLGVAGRWFREYSQEVGLNALWFSGADIGLKVNNAMAALGSGGGTIRIPAGTYTGASTMLLTNSPNVTLVGDGFLSTRITFSGSGIQAGNSTDGTKISISKLGLTGPDTAGNGSTYGIFITPANNVHSYVGFNYLGGFKTNIIWGHTSGGAFGGLAEWNEIQVYTGQIGISLGYNTAATEFRHNNIQGFNGAADTSSVGVLVHGGAGYDTISLNHGFIEGMGRQVVITNDYGGIVNMTISNVHFEEGGTAGGTTSVGIDAGGNITSLSVRECVFLESTAGGGPSACTNAVVIRDGVKNFSWRDNYTFNHLGNAVQNLNTDAAAGYSIVGGKSFDSLSPIFDSFIGVDFNLNGRDNINVIKAMTNSTIYVTNLFQSPNLTVTTGTTLLGSSSSSPVLSHAAGDGVVITRPSSYAQLTLTGANGNGGIIAFKDVGGTTTAEIDGFASAAGEDPIFWIKTSGTRRFGIMSGSSTLRSNGAGTVTTSTGALTLSTGGGNGAIIADPDGTGTFRIVLANVPVYANNAAALAGGLVAGDVYRTGADPDPLCIVH